MNRYDKQDRGNLSAYEAYFAGMDSSMQQKIALTTAHFPSRGTIADMGSGSGSGTYDLARLHHDLRLIGVDINPVTVDYSKAHYQLENLTFEVGDIAENVFEPGSLDGILDSSVLHHVTSFNGFDIAQIVETISNQVGQLRPGGVLIIRDFVVPDDAERYVFLDLPNNDGSETGEIPSLSTAALFEVFARDFRSSVNLAAGVSNHKLPSPREGFNRFRVTFRTAAEFVLRKDYRDHWAPELLEEYTYCSQADFEHLFRSNNLRIVVSMPLWNPWIVANRFRGKFFILDLNDEPVHFPPTNYLIVGEKVAKSAGVVLAEAAGRINTQPTFLSIRAYRHKETNQIFELAMRPNQTIDLLPWFENREGQLFILAKKDFPRPIINAEGDTKHLNHAQYSGYLTEPIAAIVAGGESDIEVQIRAILLERADLAAAEIIEIGIPNFYFTSAGGIDERVESFLVKLAAGPRRTLEIKNYTPFTAAGEVRELDALQVLRASHVGGMFDARLEINIYRLLRTLKRSAGAWIGEDIKPIPQRTNARIENELLIENRMIFEPAGLGQSKFLSVKSASFAEFDSNGDLLAEHDYEYVVPRHLSKNTVAAIPFFLSGGGVFIGIEFRDLPAPQSFTNNSSIGCTPAWRLPSEIEHKFDLAPFLEAAFPRDFNVAVNQTWELGGSYFTSAGITPEVVYPFAVELVAADLGDTDLKFFELNELLANAEQIQDAHLLILLNRLAHALGALKTATGA